ncbi:MAG: CBS domain-containing protein [Afipia sp.]|nr:CBS domain-containing protein [Afipia sp.]
MKVSEIMTTPVIGVSPDATLLEMTGLMVQNHISGLPVVDKHGKLVGMVTEGDCLRRAELGTEKKQSSWATFFSSTDKLAENYIRSHGRKVSDIMTGNPITVGESASVVDAVALMEKNRVKRLPVVNSKKLVGIVSRANIVQALMSRSLHMPAADTSDKALEREVCKAIDQLTWAPGSLVEVRVTGGIAELRGVAGQTTSVAMQVAAENVPGIKSVKNFLATIEPVADTTE